MEHSPLVVRHETTHPVVLAVLVFVSFGIVGLLLIAAWLFDRRPHSVDAQGLTVGRGHRRLWSDLKDIKRVDQRSQRGALVGSWYTFRFGSGNVVVNPTQIENGAEVVARIEAILGRSLDRASV